MTNPPKVAQLLAKETFDKVFAWLRQRGLLDPRDYDEGYSAADIIQALDEHEEGCSAPRVAPETILAKAANPVMAKLTEAKTPDETWKYRIPENLADLIPFFENRIAVHRLWAEWLEQDTEETRRYAAHGIGGAKAHWDYFKQYSAAKTLVEDHVRDAVAPQSQANNLDDIGWVIERGDSSPAAPTYWSGPDMWSQDHMDAIRFARKLDAERVSARARLRSPNNRVCEHMWIGAALASPVVSQGGAC